MGLLRNADHTSPPTARPAAVNSNRAVDGWHECLSRISLALHLKGPYLYEALLDSRKHLLECSGTVVTPELEKSSLRPAYVRKDWVPEN